MREVIYANPACGVEKIPEGAVIAIHGSAKGYRRVRVVSARQDAPGRWVIESEPVAGDTP